MCFRFLFFLLFSFVFSFSNELLLLQKYDEKDFKNENIQEWLMSEKLDGVRAFWDGKNFYTRNKNKINAPKFFTKNFPNFALDGELFIDKNSFDEISSIVRKNEAEIEWQKVKYMVFDVPNACDDLQSCSLKNRLLKLELFLKDTPSKFIKIIEQKEIKDKKELENFVDLVHSLGGEGVVLRKNLAPYEKFRSKNALKIKKEEEDDCTVIAYTKGKGKFENLIGALICQANIQGEMKSFKIGSGLSNALRANPPKIGQKIRYKFNGYTKKGLPRFAVFKGIRAD